MFTRNSLFSILVFLICSCSKSNKTSVQASADKPEVTTQSKTELKAAPVPAAANAPITVSFIAMVKVEGAKLPKVGIVNQTQKGINGIEFEYQCFDQAGKDITGDLHKWGMTGAEPPADPLLAPEAKDDAVVGLDDAWIPDGTVRITTTPIWVKFADGTEWHKG